jgi:SMP-30/Gluconolactonase/LRE-like region
MTRLPDHVIPSTPALPVADLEAAAAYARQEKAPATRRAYRTDFQAFRVFCSPEELTQCRLALRPWPLAREQWDLTYSGVYRLSPDLGTLTLLLDDMVFPNGLAFSPDESVLYINDFRRGHIRAFDMTPNGTWQSRPTASSSISRAPSPAV